MRFKSIIAATASLALVATPTVAAAAQAAPPAATEVAPASENVSGSELHGGFILPLIALAAIILVIVLATRHHHTNLPTSP